VSAALPLTPAEARRAAISAQLLAGPRPTDVTETVRQLWMLQMDPTSAVARTEHLVLFSRLGTRYRPAHLERALWQDRTLFEYRAFILPMDDLPIHLRTMRSYPPADSPYVRHAWVREFLEQNDGFRRHILARMRREGALRTRDLENLIALEWRTGGWNDGDGSVSMMLELLWAKGEIMIVGRDGQQRIWDLAERRLPKVAPAPAAAVATTVVKRQLAAAGIERRHRLGWLFDGMKAPGWERAVDTMIRDGRAVPARVDGVKGEWLADATALEAPFRGRTVALSPFDRLIHDRTRTEALFGFDYRLEIYVPKTERRWGYFVLPVLRGDRLVGRFDPRFDRESRVLRIGAVHAEEGSRAGDAEAVRRAIGELARWLGAVDIAWDGPLPTGWARTLRG
jgi:uncharacterized protein YcaQ